jgi:phenylalanyl-tRNA synthetase alpha chain
MTTIEHPLITEAQARIASGEKRSQIRESILGRDGSLKLLLRELGTMAAHERKEANDVLTKVRVHIEALLDQNQASEEKVSENLDWTMPAMQKRVGSLHPISSMITEMVGIFTELSFEIVEGAELVSVQENFEDLNMTIEHPARDGHDTFYITDELLLRTQTTAVQILELKKRKLQGDLPFRVVVPGRTYRREADATHSPMFHQLDAVVVDQSASFAELKGVMYHFASRLFGDEVEIRFRPHHFPFTEPSAELDVRLKNAPAGSRLANWLELGGCGMIHPDVLKRAGISRSYRGWAFGLSIERPVMIRHRIHDLRSLFTSDSAFHQQSRFLLP